MPKPITRALLMLLITAIACNAPPLASDSAQPPTAAPQPTIIILPNEAEPAPPLPPERSDYIEGLLAEVSAERLMDSVNALATIPTRHVNSPEAQRAAAVIFDAFEAAGGNLRISYQDFPLAFNEVETVQRNVIATLPGTDPQADTILVGAHYDSRTIDINDAASAAPGANDNASGVAAVIELATVLADQQFPQTIVFIAFAAEEVGAWGARAYIDREPLPDAMMVLDIIGNSAGPAGESEIRVFAAPPGDGQIDSESRALARYTALHAALYLDGFNAQVQPTVDREGRFSDHVPFSDLGVPAVRLIELIEDVDRQHSGVDFPQYVSPVYLQRSTRLALINLVSLAQGYPSPQVRVENDTYAWEALPGAGGYLISTQSNSLSPPQYTRVHAETLTFTPETEGQLVGVALVDETGIVGPFSSLR